MNPAPAVQPLDPRDADMLDELQKCKEENAELKHALSGAARDLNDQRRALVELEEWREHRPIAYSDIDDSSWIDCSEGDWDSMDAKVDWVEHIDLAAKRRVALSPAESESTTPK